MRRLPVQRRTLALLAFVLPLLALFTYVAVRSGPLAPVPVTVTAVETRSIRPALFGVGSVEARYTYEIGSTSAGRLKALHVHVGDSVRAGQLLGEIDAVDLDERILAQEAALRRAAAAVAESEARQAHAQAQARRYEKLFSVGAGSQEAAETRRQEARVADAALAAARQEVVRIRSEREALLAQRRNLRLVSPVDGLIAARNVDPGTTVVAGQAVVEVIDPESLWINARFDQIGASRLAPGLPATVQLRSREGETVGGQVQRVEPRADVVTEEMLAKVLFDVRPAALPAVGELAEVTVALPARAATPAIPNAAIQRSQGKLGVWRIAEGKLRFTPVRLGAADLEGYVEVLDGLKPGDRVVVYSERPLNARSRIHEVRSLARSAR